MRARTLIAIALAAGSIGGLVHAAASLAVTGPYIDAAIGLETRMMLETGEAQDSLEFWESLESYRAWQRQGLVLASVIHGISFASLLSIAYVLCRGRLPGGPVAGAVVLGAVMWAVLFMVPFLKYPASLPGVGDPETIGARTALYVGFVAISGVAAAAAWLASRPAGRVRLPAAVAGYAAVMAAAFALFPAAQSGGAPADLEAGFHVASVAGVSSLWASMPLASGLLWRRLGP